jgi:hypothetical protein
VGHRLAALFPGHGLHDYAGPIMYMIFAPDTLFIWMRRISVSLGIAIRPALLHRSMNDRIPVFDAVSMR